MKKVFLAIVVIALLSGCAGTNVIKISSVPDAARLYANGEYMGTTPKSVPSKWWFGGGDTVKIRIEKEGYKIVEKNIPWAELNYRYWQGDCTVGSEFGSGSTFSYTIYLEEVAIDHLNVKREVNSYKSVDEVPVVSYEYNHESKKGKLSVDIKGKGIEVRKWILKNIGQICSSKNITLEAGKESDEGGRYRVLNESVKDGILTIEFEASF